MPDKSHIAAGCTLHDGAPFVAICRQCGSYMCKLCNEDARFTECIACRQQPAREATQQQPNQPLSLSRALAQSFAVYRDNFGLVTLVVLSVIASAAAVPAVWFWLQGDRHAPAASLTFALFLAQVIMTALAVHGAIDIGVGLMRGRPVSFAFMWRGYARIPTLLVYALLAGCMSTFSLIAAMFLGLLLVAVGVAADVWPLVLLNLPIALAVFGYIAPGLCFGFAELVAQPHLDAGDALRNSFRLARGARGRILAFFFVTWVLLALGSMLFGVGLVFSFGFSLILYCALYLALRDKAALE